MAKTDEYLNEACRELERMSADEQAKLEYEARERAIRDYNSQMSSALRRGMQRGIEKGLQQGIQQGRMELLIGMLKNGVEPEEIMHLTGAGAEEVKRAAETAGVKASR